MRNNNDRKKEEREDLLKGLDARQAIFDGLSRLDVDAGMIYDSVGQQDDLGLREGYEIRVRDRYHADNGLILDIREDGLWVLEAKGNWLFTEKKMTTVEEVMKEIDYFIKSWMNLLLG